MERELRDIHPLRCVVQQGRIDGHDAESPLSIGSIAPIASKLLGLGTD